MRELRDEEQHVSERVELRDEEGEVACETQGVTKFRIYLYLG